MAIERSAAWLRSLTLEQRDLLLLIPHRIDAHRVVIVFDDELPEGFPPELDTQEELAEEEGEQEEEGEEVEQFIPDNPDPIEEPVDLTISGDSI